MHTRHKSGVIAILIILAVSLSACVNKNKDKLEPSGETAYPVTYLELGTQQKIVRDLAMRDDMIYAVEFSIGGMSGAYTLINISPEGEILSRKPHSHNAFDDLEEGFKGSPDIAKLTVCEDGGVWLLTQRYSYREDDYTDARMEYAAVRLDAAGKVDTSFIIEGIPMEATLDIELDGQGNVYIQWQNGILVYSPEGELLFEHKGYITSIARLPDGNIAVLERSDDGAVIKRLNYSTFKFTEKWEIKITPMYMYSNTSGLYLNDLKMLYEFDTETSITTAVLNWLDSEMRTGAIESFGELSNGTLVALGQGIESFERDVLLLKPVPADSLPEKENLVVATAIASETLKKEAIKFNRANSEYRIKVIEYSDYDSYVGAADGLDRLSFDITAGNSPDIILLDLFKEDIFINAGLMEDLRPYIENDPELSIDDFIPAVISAIEADDGKLYSLPREFYLNLTMGSGESSKRVDRLTIEELYRLTEETEQYKYVLSPEFGRIDFLINAVALNSESYLDYENATCSFDSSEFIELLEYAKEHLMDGEMYSSYYISGDIPRIVSGEQMLLFEHVVYFQELQSNKALFGDEINYIGFPSESGGTNAFTLKDSFGITTTSKHKDVAWEFIRGMYADELYDEFSFFPTTVSAMEKKIAEEMEPHYEENDKGEMVEAPWVDYIEGSDGVEYRIEQYAMTKEDVDEFWELLNSIDAVQKYDKDVIDIVLDVSAAYFAGDKSAEECAKLIQNRVSLYMSEQAQ